MQAQSKHCRAVTREGELPALAQIELPEFCTDGGDFPNVVQIKTCTVLALADTALLTQRRLNFFK